MGLKIIGGPTSLNIRFTNEKDEDIGIEIKSFSVTGYPNSQLVAQLEINVDEIKLENDNVEFYMMDPISQQRRKVRMIRFSDGAYIDFDGMILLTEEQAQRIK